MPWQPRGRAVQDCLSGEPPDALASDAGELKEQGDAIVSMFGAMNDATQSLTTCGGVETNTCDLRVPCDGHTHVAS